MLAVRNSRFTLCILLIVFVSFLFFARSDPHLALPLPFSDRALREKLMVEEFHYNKMLDGRAKLVEKWGPTPNKVDPFPSNGEFYTIWDFFLPSFNCPHRVERVGVMGDGGKWVCGLERIIHKKECVMYSFGINGESSFEADIMKAVPGCEVYGYDFSVKSFGPEIEEDSELKQRSHFFPFALGPKDAHSPVDDPKMYTLRTLMESNRHDFIDILKIDIEGNEYDSFEAFIDSFGGEPLPIGQLQIEIHVFKDQPWNDFAKVLKWWEKLEAAGLRPFYSEPNLVYTNLVRGARPELIEYSFINVRGDHELISSRPRRYSVAHR
ncbi:methyltransferase domain-containing protein [Pisolithus marmoratus]|nr:methyltransferase domain-containing protein [Pisolithus marmoratus]